MTERPAGTVTFLVTDIEQSTRRWEDEPEAMRAALARHDAALRDAIERHGGWMFKHTGDGVLAAFALAKPAIEAAITAQRALELPVRMGVLTGEAEPHGDDYFGLAVNRAARTMAAAHGGQIIVRHRPPPLPMTSRSLTSASSGCAISRNRSGCFKSRRPG